MTLCYPPDGWVAAHFANSIESHGKQERFGTHSSCCMSRFTARMSRANNQYIKNFWIFPHNKKPLIKRFLIGVLRLNETQIIFSCVCRGVCVFFACAWRFLLGVSFLQKTCFLPKKLF